MSDLYAENICNFANWRTDILGRLFSVVLIISVCVSYFLIQVHMSVTSLAKSQFQDRVCSSSLDFHKYL